MYHSIYKPEYVLRILLKLALIVSTVYGLSVDFSGYAMTYFTQQSNIFIAFVILIFLIMDLMTLCTNGRKDKRPQFLYVIKFMATICITLTFLIFAFVLAPAMGNLVHAYFMGGNPSSFCLHFLTPVLAIIDFIIFDDHFRIKYIYSLYAIVPPLCYLGYVLVMGQVFNYRWFGMIAPYNFINYAAPCGWFGFDFSTFDMTTIGIGVFYMVIGLILIFILIGLFYLWINRKLHPQPRFHF